MVMRSTLAICITLSMYLSGVCLANHLRYFVSDFSFGSSPSRSSAVRTPRQASPIGVRSTNRCFQIWSACSVLLMAQYFS